MSAHPLVATTLAALLGAVAIAPAGEAALMPRAPYGTQPRPTTTPKAQAPAPKPTAKPAATPRPTPTPQPSPSPAAAPAAASAEGSVFTWALPGAAGQGYDLSFASPTWGAEGTLWWDDWGVGGAATVFNTTYASFQQAPYFQANTWMVDALIRRRFAAGRYQAFAGYRGVGMADLNFATVGGAWQQPLASDWLFVKARAQVGHSFSGSYVLDGRAGLHVFLDPLTLDLGFRHLTLQAGPLPLFHVNGPTAGIGLRF